MNNLPDFIVIGAMKTGTTSLQHYLQCHPQIHMAPKELNFFAREDQWAKGIDWYRTHFRSDSLFQGEISPGYAKRHVHPEVAERIHSVVPSARIIYLVREPVGRIISHFSHSIGSETRGRTAAQILEQSIDHYVNTSKYMYQLDPYVERFGEQNILVVLSEDLKLRRDAALRSIFQFLGVDDDFESAAFDEVHHASALKVKRNILGQAMLRNPWLRKIENATKEIVPDNLHQLIGRILGSHFKNPEIPAEMLDYVAQSLVEDVDRLRRFTGYDLDGWPNSHIRQRVA